MVQYKDFLDYNEEDVDKHAESFLHKYYPKDLRKKVL